MGKNTGEFDLQSEHEKQRSEGGSAPGEHSTEKARRTHTRVVRGDQIEQDLGHGGGSRAPFGRHKRSR